MVGQWVIKTTYSQNASQYHQIQRKFDVTEQGFDSKELDFDHTV